MTSEGDEDLTPQNRRQLQRVINVGCATTFSILAGGVVYAIVFRRKQAKYGGETTIYEFRSTWECVELMSS